MGRSQDASEVVAIVESGKVKLKQPSLDDDRSIEVIFNLAKMGFSRRFVAACFGISLRTLRRRMDDFPDVRAAFLNGRREGVSDVMNTAYSLAKSGLDPSTTRWFVDKMEMDMEREVKEADEEESSAIDVTPGRTGPMTQEEVKKILGETFASDPMLKPDNESD